MPNDEFLAAEILGHGAYLFPVPSGGGDVRSAGAGRITAPAERLDLRNEFDPGSPSTRESYALLRRSAATSADIADPEVLNAGWVIQVSSSRREAVTEFCEGGVTNPRAGDRGQGPPRRHPPEELHGPSHEQLGLRAPGRAAIWRGNAQRLLRPLSKTRAWWRKDWMERHTYFLPRYGPVAC
jgi:hypothetical protein